MKLAFSTLGCPDWTFPEIVSTAIDLNFDGIEIRGIENQVFSPYAKPFLGANIDKTIATLNKKNIKISMLATGAAIGSNKPSVGGLSTYDEAVAYIDLAAKLQTPYIRLMITSNPYPEDTDIELAANTYIKICDYAKAMDKNVEPLIETNGILADTTVLKEFMDRTNCENGGVLWDVHHPYRYYGETVKTTMNNIGKFIKYVHVKDSVMMEDKKVVYKMMGLGDVPVLEALHALKNSNYTSYISLEWVKRWCPELEEAGIVFSHFSNFYKTKFL